MDCLPLGVRVSSALGSIFAIHSLVGSRNAGILASRWDKQVLQMSARYAF